MDGPPKEGDQLEREHNGDDIEAEPPPPRPRPRPPDGDGISRGYTRSHRQPARGRAGAERALHPRPVDRRGGPRHPQRRLVRVEVWPGQGQRVPARVRRQHQRSLERAPLRGVPQDQRRLHVQLRLAIHRQRAAPPRGRAVEVLQLVAELKEVESCRVSIDSKI